MDAALNKDGLKAQTQVTLWSWDSASQDELGSENSCISFPGTYESSLFSL